MMSTSAAFVIWLVGWVIFAAVTVAMIVDRRQLRRMLTASDEIRQREKQRSAELSYDLERLREELRVTAHALQLQQSITEELVDSIESIAKNSTLLPPKEVEWPGELDNPYDDLSSPAVRISQRHKLSLPKMLEVLDKPVHCVWVTIVDMYEVRATLARHETRFQQMVHVRRKGRSWGYAISDSAFHYLSSERGPEAVVKMVYETILNAMSDTLKRRRR